VLDSVFTCTYVYVDDEVDGKLIGHSHWKVPFRLASFTASVIQSNYTSIKMGSIS
jgi:hypothetical protein